MREKIIRRLCLYTWRFWEWMGLHVIPNHFYWPVKDSRTLKSYDFDAEFPLDGISMNTGPMMALISTLSKYKEEYKSIHVESGYTSNGDGAILYSMLRELRPKRVIEVGSGNSTVVMNAALEKNHAEDGIDRSIVSIEPYPKQVLLDLNSRSNNVSLIQKKVENLDIPFFQRLGEGDLLFIDTSHVVDIANDVHFLYLHVLPQLPVGVVIHIHDIRFPYEYPREWVMKDRKYWAEQYLLHMFLAFNESFEIVFASNYMCQKYRNNMSDAFYGLEKSGDGWPGSFWIKRIR